nr:hypothetical protein [Tanacetum cinerariifolium]
MKLKERIKSLSGNVKEEKIKKELEEIEMINIELDHRVTKLVAENEHLKQTYKKLYDSIKSSHVRSKEQCDDLIKQVNIKSAENSDLNASLQEKVLVITALKETLSKFKGKATVNEPVTLHPIDPEFLKIDVAPFAPKLHNNRTGHNNYLNHTQEETATLREIVENERLLNPLNTSLDYTCKYTKRIQELLIILKQTCLCINDLGTKLMAVTPKNNNKKIRFTKHIPSSGNTPVKTTSSTNVVSNTPVLSSTRVNLLSSDSGSQPQGNTKKDRIQQTQSKDKKNKLEDHPRTVRPSLNKKKSVVGTKSISSVPNSKLNVNSDLKCATCNGCLFYDNHDSCVLAYINSVNARVKSKFVKKPVNKKIWQPIGKMFTTIGHIWKPTRWTFTLVGNVCPLTRITTTAIVVQIVLWYLDSGCSKHMTGDRSQLINFVQRFMGTVKFGNDHVAKIMGYDGVDLLTGSQGNNLYTLYLQDMMASSPICLLSKASKTKSWLWHRRLSHLNFGAINHLARQGLVRGLPKLKFEKDHLCSACAMGKSKKRSHKPKSEDTNQEKLYLRHMDLCGPLRVENINGKKYILVIVDDYSRFTWVKCLRSKDEAPDFIIKFLKMIQVRLKVPVRHIQTDNGTEFVNQTLREYYEEADIGIFIGYALRKKAFWIYNRRTRRIVETIHVEFDELMAMASKQSIQAESTGLPSLTTINQDAPPPSKSQTTPETQSYVIPQDVEEDIHDIEVAHMGNESVIWCTNSKSYFCSIFINVPPVQAESTGLPSSTIVDQDAPSPSKSQTTPETQSSVIPQVVEEDIYDIEVVHMGNDPLFGVPIPEVTSAQSSSMVSPRTIVQPDHQIPQHNSK